MQQQEVLRAWILMICSNRGLGADGGGAAYESRRLLRLRRRRGEPVVDLDEDVADAMRRGMMQGFLDTVCTFGGLYGFSGFHDASANLEAMAYLQTGVLSTGWRISRSHRRVTDD